MAEATTYTVRVVRERGDGTTQTDTYDCDYVKAHDGVLELLKRRYAGVIAVEPLKPSDWEHVISIPLRRVVEWKRTRR